MKGLGWRGHIKSAHDYQARKLFKGVECPRVKELWYPPVKDQGDLGSCGAHALCTLMESVMIQNNMADWVIRGPLGLYYFYRERTGEVHVDGGVDNRILLDTAVKIGVPSEFLWPDDTTKWDQKPPLEAYKDAANHQVLEYHAINGLEEMLQCLAEGYAFLGGMPVYQSFEDVGAAGIVPMPGQTSKDDPYLGGHDLYFCGYDEYRKVIYGMNSWGKSWGKDGRFYLPYEYADRFMDGCYTITLQEG